jgi:hypothetical protein
MVRGSFHGKYLKRGLPSSLREKTPMWRLLFLVFAVGIIFIPESSMADDELPLGSFVFSPDGQSRYVSGCIEFAGNDGAQYTRRIQRNGYYSIIVKAHVRSLEVDKFAPIALFVDGLPQGHGVDPESGSDFVWNVGASENFTTYISTHIYLYGGRHTIGFRCLACSTDVTAVVCAATVKLTSSARPPPEPPGARDPTIQPLRSYNIWNTAIGSGAIWSKASDVDTQAIVKSAAGATINSGTWSIPVYVAKYGDPTGYFAAPYNNVMPISRGYTTHIPVRVQPSSDSDANITLYDASHRWMQEFLGCRPTKSLRGFACYDNLKTDVCEGQNPTGSFTSWTPGLIRVSEIQRGLIPHMLRFAMPRTMTKPPAKWWQVAWPEFQVDECGPTCYSGVVPAGATIGIPSTVNLGTLNLSPSGVVLATALQNYGAIQRATGGSPQQGIILYSEQAAESETRRQLADMRRDFVKIQPLLRIMRNQASNNVNGGGTPLRPMQPRIDQQICP